ncbi:MAG: hypothetical protein ACUVTQ_07070 [Desulfotomaculales bacterium]
MQLRGAVVLAAVDWNFLRQRLRQLSVSLRFRTLAPVLGDLFGELP